MWTALAVCVVVWVVCGLVGVVCAHIAASPPKTQADPMFGCAACCLLILSWAGFLGAVGIGLWKLIVYINAGGV